jgi:hypothetical protein
VEHRSAWPMSVARSTKTAPNLQRDPSVCFKILSPASWLYQSIKNQAGLCVLPCGKACRSDTSYYNSAIVLAANQTITLNHTVSTSLTLLQLVLMPHSQLSIISPDQVSAIPWFQTYCSNDSMIQQLANLQFLGSMTIPYSLLLPL